MASDRWREAVKETHPRERGSRVQAMRRVFIGGRVASRRGWIARARGYTPLPVAHAWRNAAVKASRRRKARGLSSRCNGREAKEIEGAQAERQTRSKCTLARVYGRAVPRERR